MLKRFVLFTTFVFVITFLLGCAARTPFQLSSDETRLDLTPDDYRVIGPAKGTDCVTVVFGIRGSNPSIKKAEQRALDSVNARFLLNKKALFGFEGACLPFYSEDCVYVEGTGIDFK